MLHLITTWPPDDHQRLFSEARDWLQEAIPDFHFQTNPEIVDDVDGFGGQRWWFMDKFSFEMSGEHIKGTIHMQVGVPDQPPDFYPEAGRELMGEVRLTLDPIHSPLGTEHDDTLGASPEAMGEIIDKLVEQLRLRFPDTLYLIAHVIRRLNSHYIAVFGSRKVVESSLPRFLLTQALSVSKEFEYGNTLPDNWIAKFPPEFKRLIQQGRVPSPLAMEWIGPLLHDLVPNDREDVLITHEMLIEKSRKLFLTMNKSLWMDFGKWVRWHEPPPSS